MARKKLVRSLVALALWLGLPSLDVTAETIGTEALIAPQPEARFNRFVNMRPGDGQTVQTNPPRFSWFYIPEAEQKLAAGQSPEGSHEFTLQISRYASFSSLTVNVVTPYNFYNFLPSLLGPQQWYWRVGYDVGTVDEWWSPVSSFVIADDAVVWDRVGLASPPLQVVGHPRILFNSGNLGAIRDLESTEPECAEILTRMRNEAAVIMATDWWVNFPATDTVSASAPFSEIAHGLAHVAFLWVITGEAQYSGVTTRAVTLASYPRGGGASPEGAGGDSGSNSTQTTEFLALLFDWLYQDLSSAERQIMITALEWRVEYWVNEFGGWTTDGINVHKRSLAARSKSHVYEGSMDTAPAALALYGHSAIGEEWYRLITNYLIGVTNGFGFEEGWNEGAGYGPSKLKWLMYSTVYFDTALQADLGRNPFYWNIGDFFCRLTPVGLPHSPWGNLSVNADFKASYKRIFRQLAFLTGDGRVLRHWREDGGSIPHLPSDRLWIEYSLPHYYPRPTESVQTETAAVFPVAGWAMAASHPPSTPDSFSQGAGVIFQARARGGYSHSFNSDGSFQIYALGEQINHGGSNTLNLNAFAYHAMSHTSLLVDGLGQAQPDIGQTYPEYSRIIGFKTAPDVTYLAADLTDAYPHQPGDYTRWGLPLDPVYTERACDHLNRLTRHILFVRNKYVCVYDSIETSRPATFTWLYHILPQQSPLDFNSSTFEIDYAVGDVNVKLRHVGHASDLQLDDRQGTNGMINPFTGENYLSSYIAGDPEAFHNLWISNQTQTTSFQFLAVIFPYQSTDPEPTIARIDDHTVQVTADGYSDVITFFPSLHPEADIAVDVPAILLTTSGGLVFADGFESGSLSAWSSH